MKCHIYIIIEVFPVISFIYFVIWWVLYLSSDFWLSIDSLSWNIFLKTSLSWNMILFHSLSHPFYLHSLSMIDIYVLISLFFYRKNITHDYMIKFLLSLWSIFLFIFFDVQINLFAVNTNVHVLELGIKMHEKVLLQQGVYFYAPI